MSGFNPTPAVFHSRINGPNFMSFGNPLHGFHNQFDFYGVEKLGEHIAVAVNAYDKQRALIETLVKALEEISGARWNEDGDLDDVCTVAERALAAAKEITQ